MRLEELVNKNFDKLNENDKMIWQYIQENILSARKPKRMCEV